MAAESVYGPFTYAGSVWVSQRSLAQIAHLSWSRDSREPYEMCRAADLRIGLNMSCL
jgi:hypothetical protein